MSDEEINKIFDRIRDQMIPKESNKDNECTCREDMKHRPLCPVCDKADFELHKHTSREQEKAVNRNPGHLRQPKRSS